ncbi:glycosyltransferase [Pseudarthrobacter sp. NBSH8]|uniref:glycosyltransferase n=1 Tax=Pseudarthrobacter sp. NBSH8 TaxID=2596911 RepID=UPI0016287755|nr:glycosyltransferase [Pseudarthrobacter sp. NBSH8]
MIPSTTDNILASSYALAHLRRTTGLKVIYCHSPFRQIYSGVSDYFPSNPFAQRLVSILLASFRYLDKKAANEADVIIATNTIVADRIREFWGLDADAVIPPPIDTQSFHPVDAPKRTYFVWVGRIVEPYKRVGLLMDTLRDRPDLSLLVVGDGRDRLALEATAPSNVTFVGNKTGDELSDLIANAEALIFPSSDDFGMVPLEAMAAGTPVIGFSGGGARETVINGQTGVLFNEPTISSLSDAIDHFRTIRWDYEAIRSYSLQYGQEGFVEKMRAILKDALFTEKGI